MKLLNLFPIMGLLVTSLSVSAGEWNVESDASKLSFISTKKQNISEVHEFKALTGQLSASGQFQLNIDLSSVDTGIDIRNSRMKEFLFNIAEYPQATLTANLDEATVSSLAVSQIMTLPIEASLSLHGQTQPIKGEVKIIKINDTQVFVTSTKPLILNVADYALVEGVEKLRELAGLPNISYAVPVSFYLTLNAVN